MIELRKYQRDAVELLWQWFRDGNGGNPVLVLPTGSGKSLIAAAIVKDAVSRWKKRMLILSHVKEILGQNERALRRYWPDADIGVYSASLDRRETGRPVTIAGIASIYKRAESLGRIDMVIIDECHRVSPDDWTMYAQLLNELKPARVVGLTATPYRLVQGLITSGDNALFHAIIEPVQTLELVGQNFLSPLRSKFTDFEYDTSSISIQGGEFVEVELQSLVGEESATTAVVEELRRWGRDRKSWLIFCVGVRHSFSVMNELLRQGISAECIVGDTPAKERDDILRRFKAGEVQAVTNANVLTTGFDHPGIDLIAMLRPTMSPTLYVQMAGRGMRVADGKKDCLVLDYAGNIARHGPITDVQPPQKTRRSAPVARKCPDCREIVSASKRICPECGYEWPEPTPAQIEYQRLQNKFDIMGRPGDIRMYSCIGWSWVSHTAQKSGKVMPRVDYESLDAPVSIDIREFFCVEHDGYAKRKATEALAEIAAGAEAKGEKPLSYTEILEMDTEEVLRIFPHMLPPSKIIIEKDGNWWRVVSRFWEAEEPVDVPF